MFNEYLFHLCDCTCLNVMCVCSIACWLNQNFFECFICFWKWFLSLLFWKLFSKSKKIDVEKVCVWQFRNSFREWMQFHPSHEMKWENLVPLKNQVESFATHLQVVRDSSLTYKMKMRKFQFLHKFRQRVLRLKCKCLMTQI